MEIKINLDELERKGLSLAQYLFMWSLYHDLIVRDRENLSADALADLVSRKLIIRKTGEWWLTESAARLFESSAEMFDEFIEKFPTRATFPNGSVRVLSPASANTVAGKKLKKKWCTIVKGNVDFEQKIIKCLEAEVKLRKREGTLHFMKGIEPWLNNGEWESYEYLLSDSKPEGLGSTINDRVGVIRL